jgi:hypothetical protein
MKINKHLSVRTAGVLGCALLAITAVWYMGIYKSFAANQPTVITLTQTGCQFVESEGEIDRMFKTMKADDCIKINETTGKERLKKSAAIVLKPGKYVFRVTNKNVPYGLGFWLRGSGLGRITLPSISGGGLNVGVTKDYVIDLKPGKYLYSCPLNPTPDYPLIVRG